MSTIPSSLRRICWSSSSVYPVLWSVRSGISTRGNSKPCFFIYLQFPSWKEHARRLSESCDHWNTRSWTGDVDPRKVNLVNAWATGFRISYGKLLATRLLTATDLDIDAIPAKDKTISLIYPKGSKEPLIFNDADDGVEAAVGDAPSDITDAATENADAAPTPPSEPEPERADMDLDAASATAASTAAASATAAPTTAAPTAPTATEDVSIYTHDRRSVLSGGIYTHDRRSVLSGGIYRTVVPF